MSTVNNVEFDQLNKVQAANDNILVIVPIIKEVTESDIFKGEKLVQEEAKDIKDDIFVAAVGPLVQDTNIKVGDQILISGMVTILPEHVAKCPLKDYQYASVKGYHVITVIKS